jgi:hypothetical protein
MAHPFYRKIPFKKRSTTIWTIGFILLVLILAVPWILPVGISSSEPFATIKAITTFPLEYEWHHSYIYEPDKSLPVQNPSGQNNSPGSPVVSSPYFPLAIGNIWIYEHIKKGGMMDSQNETVSTKTIEIISSKEVKGLTLYEFKSTENEKITSGYYFYDDQGLKFTRDDKRPDKHSLLILKDNPQVDDTWLETSSSDVEYSVQAIEDFTTKAGTFNCILVRIQYSKSSDRSYQAWYAKGVGIVSQKHGSEARGLDEWNLVEYHLK